jgi:YidC/Oxa1 family membrane protein insertase
MDKKTNLVFILFMVALLLGWYVLGDYFWPQKPPEPKEPPPTEQAKPEGPDKPEEKPPPQPEEPGDPESRRPVVLGSEGGHLEVVLDPRGAAVRKLVARHFQSADALGRPEWETIDGRRVKKPLELIREDYNTDVGSFVLHHYRNPEEDFPTDTLARRVWRRVEPAELVEGQPVQRAVFETVVRGVRITKTYTIEPRWYHVGLEVKLELAEPDAKEAEFRYLLTGGRGLPIEGQWYTSTLRNALIGRVNAKGEVDRDFQDLRQISHHGGGNQIVKGDFTIRYAGVAVQFFASVIAVDTRDQPNKDFLAHARPLLLQSSTPGQVVKAEGNSLVVEQVKGGLFGGGERTTHTFELPDSARARYESLLNPGGQVIVVHRPVIDLKGARKDVVTQVLDPATTAPIFHDDITVAVATAKGIKVKAGEPVVHKYVLYNGPVKVGQLNQLELDQPVDGLPAGAPAVDEAMVTFYRDDLHLKTLTDYPNSWLGRTFNVVGLTDLVIWFTNVMHSVLWFLYRVVSSVAPEILAYGLCIILLTVLVRGAMFPISRKQALTSLRMQELAPELKKLQEKHKGDRQAMAAAQMELYRKHGVSPFGTCWLLLLQMPIFMGLYFALQESIHFRLAPFLYIPNLAAPDMLFSWSDKIPWISQPSAYGGFLYLGPFFNLLPVVAVSLMLVQQKMTMPPPADEQAEMQMKMMKYMMIFMGLMFYKVAAGLCIYFIASSLWGFAERKLLPKRKKDGAPLPPPKPGLLQRLLGRASGKPPADGLPPPADGTGGTNGAPQTASPPPVPLGRGKKKRSRDRKKGDRRPEAPDGAAPDGTLGKVRTWWDDVRDRVRGWWAEILKQAEKK